MTIACRDNIISVDKDKLEKVIDDNVEKIKKEYNLNFRLSRKENTVTMLYPDPMVIFKLTYSDGYLFIIRIYMVNNRDEREVIGLLLTIMAEYPFNIRESYRIYDNLKVFVNTNISRTIMSFYLQILVISVGIYIINKNE